jgi:hypothetical protein
VPLFHPAMVATSAVLRDHDRFNCGRLCQDGKSCRLRAIDGLILGFGRRRSSSSWGALVAEDIEGSIEQNAAPSRSPELFFTRQAVP